MLIMIPIIIAIIIVIIYLTMMTGRAPPGRPGPPGLAAWRLADMATARPGYGYADMAENSGLPPPSPAEIGGEYIILSLLLLLLLNVWMIYIYIYMYIDK